MTQPDLSKEADSLLKYTQDIEVGPIKVDTGNDWMDFAFVIALLLVIALIVKVLKVKFW